MGKKLPNPKSFLSLGIEPPPSPSSTSEPIKAMPLRWYPPIALASLSSTPSSSYVDQCKTHVHAPSLFSVNQSPEVWRLGMNMNVSDSDAPLPVSIADDHKSVEEKPPSTNGFWLFGTWISEGETTCENKRHGLGESSKIIKKKKRTYTRPLLRRRPVHEGSYKDNIGELIAEKILRKSDINQSSRLLLSRETVERRLLPILNENYPNAEQNCKSLSGLRIEIFDADTDDDGNRNSSYALVLKQWITKSFVFTGSWKREFVGRRNLKEDDQIGLFWDQNQRRINFSVKQIRS